VALQALTNLGPAEQPPLAVFTDCTIRYWVDMWSALRIPQLHFQLSKPDRYFFIQVTTQFIRISTALKKKGQLLTVVSCECWHLSYFPLDLKEEDWKDRERWKTSTIGRTWRILQTGWWWFKCYRIILTYDNTWRGHWKSSSFLSKWLSILIGILCIVCYSWQRQYAI
jgi:hypothetical protein